jgi:hypothetical protein
MSDILVLVVCYVIQMSSLTSRRTMSQAPETQSWKIEDIAT